MKLNTLTKDTKIINDFWKINLDYANKNNNVASVFASEGNLHPYPAKAVPDMVHELLSKIKQVYGIESVLDPFVGSGTVALESKILGLDFYGSDLNPLAVLLARTKALTIKDTIIVKDIIEKFVTEIKNNEESKNLIKLVTFKNIAFWFKNENILQLSFLKSMINAFLEKLDFQYVETISLIVFTAFSSTVRESSLTRNDEFKLYKMSPSDIEKFNVNSLDVFKNTVSNLLSMLHDANEIYKNNTISKIFLENAKKISYLGDKKVSLVLTSPPYGDSSSTVAYGQFSRLPVQWMADLLKKYLNICSYTDDCDEYLLGGKHSISTYSAECLQKQTEVIQNSSESLKKLINKVDSQIKTELKQLNKVKTLLLNLKNDLRQGKTINYKALMNNEDLSILVIERIRLSIYREINQKATLTKKEVKSLAKIETEKFLSELDGEDIQKRSDREKTINKMLPLISEAINRKIIYLPKRGNEILKFFIDLYEVVCQTNNVLKNDGIQAWIVGHRTVLGKLNVKMADILSEWFVSLGYSKVALIKRKYHFKRLPHHINSTLTRNKEIKTMMEEHVLIVQKGKKSVN